MRNTSCTPIKTLPIGDGLDLFIQSISGEVYGFPFGLAQHIASTHEKNAAGSPNSQPCLSSGERRERFGARAIHIPCIFPLYSLFNGQPRSYLEFPNHLICVETFLCCDIPDPGSIFVHVSVYGLAIHFGCCSDGFV